jgi:hypothetical protein
VSRCRKGNAARLIKPLLALLALAAGAGVAFALAAAGSTELGGTTTAPVVSVNTPMVQLSTTPGTSSYTTPDGVLTSWRYHSTTNPVSGTLRLMLFQPGASPHTYQAMASTDTKPVVPNTGYEFKERIPVKQGWVLGLAPFQAYVAMPPGSGSDVMDGFPADVHVGDTATWPPRSSPTQTATALGT